jgi:starvation-inducible outer membrane lipoprotein
MEKLTKTVGIGALILALNGCGDTPKYQEGRVTNESGTAVDIVESRGALFGNESVRFGRPTYCLTVETSRGTYVMDVFVRPLFSKSLVALGEAIKVGDSIRFRTNSRGLIRRDYFSSDRIGCIPSDEIELLKKY